MGVNKVNKIISFYRLAELHILRGNKMILFDYTDENNKWKTGKKLAKFLSGKEGAFISTYTIKTEELLNLMRDYKSKSK